MSIAIMGIGVVAILTGVLAFVGESNRHRDQASANTVLVGALEALVDPVRTPYNATCAATPYTTADALDGVTLPTGWPQSTVAITAVRYWDGTAFGATCYDNAASNASVVRLQELTVTVTSPGGKAVLSMAAVKRGA